MRISVTEIDAFRRYKANENVDLPNLLASLRREKPPTIAMQAGRALHGVLEHAGEEELDVVERDGFTFRFAGDFELALPRVRELKGEMEMHTAYGPVTLVGVVDGLDGTIYDHKLTARFDAERYTDSYQWRCYLTMFGAVRFVYNVFEAREDDGEWLIYAFHPFALYSYPGMAEDVKREVSEFAGFLAKHLPERL